MQNKNLELHYYMNGVHGMSDYPVPSFVTEYYLKTNSGNIAQIAKGFEYRLDYDFQIVDKLPPVVEKPKKKNLKTGVPWTEFHTVEDVNRPELADIINKIATNEKKLTDELKTELRDTVEKVLGEAFGVGFKGYNLADEMMLEAEIVLGFP